MSWCYWQCCWVFRGELKPEWYWTQLCMSSLLLPLAILHDNYAFMLLELLRRWTKMKYVNDLGESMLCFMGDSCYKSEMLKSSYGLQPVSFSLSGDLVWYARINQRFELFPLFLSISPVPFSQLNIKNNVKINMEFCWASLMERRVIEQETIRQSLLKLIYCHKYRAKRPINILYQQVSAIKRR